MLLAETGPDIYVATMPNILSSYYYYLEENLNNLKGIKLKIYAGQNVAYFCAEIFVDDESLKSARTLNPKHLVYINCIFEDNYYYRLSLREIWKYKEVVEFIKNVLCDTWI